MLLSLIDVEFSFHLVSGTIIENSVIFPKSAVAFLILNIRDIVSKNDRYALDEKVVER